MADGVEFNLDEVYGLIADLSDIEGVVNREVVKSVQQTAMETKKSMAADARKTMPKSIARRYAPTIDYELRDFGAFGQGIISAEVGPNLKRYGGKTGKGGLLPSMGILDDPESAGGIRSKPARVRPRGEKFAGEELEKRGTLAVEESLKKAGL